MGVIQKKEQLLFVSGFEFSLVKFSLAELPPTELPPALAGG
jgi:hypothetical protein